ncbi:uncharacterized protein LOC111048642 isoform X2 [Nilaparvata lugens]|uniref:uncharacterized protein LOC111048642 isoform X2 n=1 Tax=Nilaparvata lugens TaxID=108931 RepID=UPI00193DF3AA|nr:uncharacterized protein LOC111048642 isoform X2 [Nilaparvata lugens]
MKVSIIFSTIIIFSTHAIAAGSDDKSDTEVTFSVDDFPYIIYDLPQITWLDVSTNLENLKDEKLNRLIEENRKLLENVVLANVVRGLIVQHCFARHFANDYTPEELSLMKTAIKTGLEISKTRVQSEGSGSDDEASVALLKATFEQMKTVFKTRVREDSLVSKMLDNAKYAIRVQVMEYIIVSLSNTQIAYFLSELFTLMDNGRPNDPSFFIQAIVSKNQVDDIQQEKSFIQSPPRKDLVKYFGSCVPYVEMYSMHENHQGSLDYLNKVIENNCRIYWLSNKCLGVKARLVLNLAHETILKHGVRTITNVIRRMGYNAIKFKTDDHLSRNFINILNSHGLKSKVAEMELSEEEISTINDILSRIIMEIAEVSSTNKSMFMMLRIIFDMIEDGEATQKVKFVLNVV